MGQMGAQMAHDEQVKQFAQKMVDDHQQGDQKLTQWAQQQGVDLTSSKAYQAKLKEAKKDMQKVHGKSGAAFDKSYMATMVKDHEKDSKDVKKLADQARKENQTELAAMLDQTHTAMQGHLEQAKQIEKATKSGGTRQGRKGATTSGTGSSGMSPSGGASGSSTTAPSGSPDPGQAGASPSTSTGSSGSGSSTDRNPAGSGTQGGAAPSGSGR
jgi:putative membrane protein